jgi:lysophospholipase L1-like esterase
MDICFKWGIPYLNLWDGSYMNPSIESCYDPNMTGQQNIDAGKLYIDGQHPTPTGYEYMTPMIQAWMETL